MNPHSKGGHAAAGTQALGLPASPPPPFPRRTIVADYCRTCGRTSGCWQGCAGGERVAAISHTRSGVAATMGVQTSAPRDSLQLPGALDRGMVIPDV